MIKNIFGRIILAASLFAGAFLISTVSVNAASVPKVVDSGAAGSSVTWTLYDNGELKFTGSGDIDSFYNSSDEIPTYEQAWYKYRRNTKKIIIGDGITSIGDAAFVDFPETEISWPKASLTSIGRASFANNSSLSKIIIPASVDFLDEGAFKNCKAAKEIEIKGAITTIPKECFTNMSDALITIADGCQAVYSKAFYGSATRIEFPASVYYLAPDSLDVNNKWKLVKGGSAEVKLVANNNYIPYIDSTQTYTINPKYIKFPSVSYRYTGQKVIPEVSITYVDGKDSTALVEGKDYELVFGSDKSKSLGKHSVEVRGIGSFTGSKVFSYTIYAYLEDCDVKLSYTSVPADGSRKKPTAKVTCNGLLLKEGSHYTVSYSNNIKAGDGQVTITAKSNTFCKGSTQATFIIFDKTRFYYEDCIYMVCNVTENSKEVMLADADIDTSSFKIPATVEYDGEEYDVVQIGQYAFKNCKILKKLTVGSNVEKIKDGAFYGCTNLTKITLPAKLQSIGNKAFVNCLSLKDITIPSKVKSIGKSAFLGCKLLKSVTIKTDLLTDSSVGASAFKNINRKALVYVNAGKLKDYKKLLSKKGLNSSSQKVVAIKK